MEHNYSVNKKSIIYAGSKIITIHQWQKTFKIRLGGRGSLLAVAFTGLSPTSGKSSENKIK